VKLTNEFIQGVRVVKSNAWEHAFEAMVRSVKWVV
jgi:hypothetical protein